MQIDGADFALRAAEALRDVLPQLMFVTSARGATTYVNRPWLDYTGLDAARATRDGWLAAVDPVAAPEARRAWARAVAADGPFEARLRMRRGVDGALRWFLCRAAPVRESDGSVGSFVGTCTDVDAGYREVERQRMLSETSRLLASGAPLRARLGEVAARVVPVLGDWSAFASLDADGSLVLEAAAHADARLAAALAPSIGRCIRRATSHDASRIAAILGADGGPERFALASPGDAERILGREIADALAPFRPGSVLAVRLGSREATSGLLLTGTGPQPAPCEDGDLEAATELAQRVSLTIETDRMQARRAAQDARLRFIADAGRTLGESLDLGETLRALLRLLVPALADWAVIHIVHPDGSLRAAAAQHRDAREDAALATIVGVAGGSEWDAGAAAAISSAGPYLEIHTGETARATLRGRPGDPEFAIGTIAYRARASVPLRAHGKTVGALSVARVDARGYGTEDVELFDEIAQRSALAVANASAFEREHRVSSVLQAALLPAKLPNDGDFAFHAVYRPGRTESHVGGDWYDALRLYDGRIVISIGDVAGTGLAAAVTMASMRQVIRGIAQVQPDPALMLDAADKVLRDEGDGHFVTAFVGVLDPVTLDFTFASAGHPPPLVRRADGRIEALGLSSPPLGLRRPMEGGTQTIDLEEGSLVVLYTDGLIETTRDPIAGEAALHGVVADAAVLDAEDVAAAIFARLVTGESHDDIALMTVGVRTLGRPTPAERDRFSMRVDLSDAEQAHVARRAFLERLRTARVPEGLLDATELIVGELLGNVVRHAPGRAELVFDRQREAIVVHVIDRGHGFDVAPSLPRDQFSENGRGLFLISRLASEFQITRRPCDGSHARVVLATDAGPAGRPNESAAGDEARLL